MKTEIVLILHRRCAAWPDIRHQTNPATANDKTQSFNGKSLSIRDRRRRRRWRGGAGMWSWRLERRTRDWKVAGSNPCWSGGRIFFSRVDFLCWLLFRYPFHPRVTAVARKRSRSFCQSAGGMLQLNTHTPYICGFAWSDMVHGCMVYTGPAPRRLQFHVAPAMPAL